MTHPTTIGKYVVTRFLTSGGMGSLYLCEDPDVPRLVAIKILTPQLQQPEFRERFRREVSVVGRLRHPNIVTVLGVEMHEGSPCLVMEYIPGETLRDVVRRRPPLSMSRRLKILQDICAALAHAHAAGIVHRDIKPSNLMIEPGGIVKILDFGIARTSESDLTRTGVVLGTLNYMAPEQMKGGDVDYRADIFSVGAVMYELLSYTHAFPGATRDEVAARVMHAEPVPLEEIRSEIPQTLSAIAAKALQKDPGRRYQDVRMMRAALEVAARSLEAQPPAGPVEAFDERTLVRSPNGSSAAAEAVGTLARDIPDCLTEARQAITTGEFARAAGLCRDVLEVDPAHVGARTLLARAATGHDAPVPRARRWHEWTLSLGAGAMIVGVAVWSGWTRDSGTASIASTRSAASEPTREAARVDVQQDTVVLPQPSPTNIRASEPESPEPPEPPEPAERRPAAPPEPLEPPEPREVAPIAVPPPIAPPPAVVPAPEIASPPATPPSSPPPPSDRQLIAALLDAYAIAMTSRIVPDVARVYAMTRDTQSLLERQFGDLQSWKIVLAGRLIEVDEKGQRARVSATMRYEEVVPRGRRPVTVAPQPVTLELSKASGSWMILNVQ